MTTAERDQKRRKTASESAKEAVTTKEAAGLETQHESQQQAHEAEYEVTCSAPVNIAVIKYWGKRNTQLLLPTNSSLSVTLSQDDLRSTTTVRSMSDEAGVDGQGEGEGVEVEGVRGDRLWLNGKEESIAASKRLRNVLAEARRMRRAAEAADPLLPRLADRRVHAASVNNFPTAAGLASSASGFACLTFALYQLFGLDSLHSLSAVSRVARVGSGSACRSLFGGFVAWEMGSAADGEDSLAVQIAPEDHWPEIHALILVVSDARKDTGSTEGMQQTCETSSLLHHRIHDVVPKRMTAMVKAIQDRDFDAFAELTMTDSNQFHAVCLDTFPPIFYMNDISRAIIRLVSAYNSLFTTTGTSGAGALGRKGYRAAYTYDAGPNAVLYLQRDHVPEVLGLINHFFPAPANAIKAEYYGRAADNLDSIDAAHIQSLAEQITAKTRFTPYPAGSLQRIISTHVGDGPRVLSRVPASQDSLLDPNGMPKL